MRTNACRCSSAFSAPTLFPDVSKVTQGFYRGKVGIGEQEVLVITLTRYQYINFPPGNRIFRCIRDKMERELKKFVKRLEIWRNCFYWGEKEKVFQRSLNPCFASDTKFLLAKCGMNTFEWCAEEKKIIRVWKGSGLQPRRLERNR